MTGKKCEPGCTCKRHTSQPKLSEEEARERRRASDAQYHQRNRDARLADNRLRARERIASASPEEIERLRERQREISRAHYERNRAAKLEQARRERLDPEVGPEIRRVEQERIASLSPEERERRAQLNKDWYAKRPRSSEEHSRMHFWTRYRITPERRQQFIDAQDGCCYLCGDRLLLDQPRKVHVDHDHACCSGNTACGKCIRGVACDPCNRGIGYFLDDPDRMERVAASLRAAKSRPSPKAELARTAVAPCPQGKSRKDREP